MTEVEESVSKKLSLAALKVAVVVPCKNEALTIGRVITDFRRELTGADIWVCDNRSTDKTASYARLAGARIVEEERPGKGHAVRRLFSAADADVYVLVDGDGTYDSSNIREMIERLRSEHLDMVIGRRIATGEVEHDVVYRRGHAWGNHAFATAVSYLFGYKVHDVFSGYRVFSRRFIKSFPALSTGFEIEIELTIHALDLCLPIREVDCWYGPRPDGSISKLNTYRDGGRIALALIYLLEQTRPAFFFGVLGAMTAMASLALGIPVVVEYMRVGLVPRLPTAVLASSLMVLGLMIASCGVILDSVGRGRKEAKRLAYLAAGSVAALS